MTKEAIAAKVAVAIALAIASPTEVSKRDVPPRPPAGQPVLVVPIGNVFSKPGRMQESSVLTRPGATREHCPT